MSITAIYVFTTTAFTVDVPSTIEQLAENASGGYSVVPKAVGAGQRFTLERGVYRLNSGAKITAAPGFTATALSTRGTTTTTTGHIIALSGTKSNWPDPGAVAASTSLNVPLSAMQPFLTDTGEEAEI